MDIQIRSFFVTFVSRCIQAADCTKADDALIKARSMVNEQEDALDSFLNCFIKEWEVDSSGLTIITKPMKHELFYDALSDNHYGKDFPMNKRNNRYEIGCATIHIPIQSLSPIITFDNQEFVHGHITEGQINCWGKYKTISKTVLHEGPLAALGAMYGFCKYSRYGTYLKSNAPEPANA